MHFGNAAINYADCGVARSSRYGDQPQQQQQKGQEQVVGRKNSQTVLASNDSSDLMNQSRPNYFNTGGLSAWGMITIIIVVILLGMAGYYGIMCYPLICRKEDHYNIMHDGASTSSSGSPIRATEYEKYEKQGNYSSRSTTPSKSHE